MEEGHEAVLALVILFLLGLEVASCLEEPFQAEVPYQVEPFLEEPSLVVVEPFLVEAYDLEEQTSLVEAFLRERLLL